MTTKGVPTLRRAFCDDASLAGGTFEELIDCQGLPVAVYQGKDDAVVEIDRQLTERVYLHQRAQDSGQHNR
jgi:hypothetical protein